MELTMGLSFLVQLMGMNGILAASIESSHGHDDAPIKCGMSKEFFSKKYYIHPEAHMTYMEMTQLPTCNHPNDSLTENHDYEEGERIIGSLAVDSSAAFPWIANLRYRKDEGSVHVCGAVVITEYLLLTAAHCVAGSKPSSYMIRVGEYHQQMIEDTEEDFEVADIIMHERYQKEIEHNNDIALIKIKPYNGHGMTFNRYVQPVCLPSVNTPYKSDIDAAIGGWGVTESGDLSWSLLVAHVPLVDRDHCDILYKDTRITEGMVCAGQIEGVSDSCQGDSGGPMVATINGRTTLLGLVSWGFGCAQPYQPGVYTNVQHYLPWIMKAMLHICN